MPTVRTVVFWTHFAIGVSAFIVILMMSVTGAVLAFEPQILAVLERNVRRVDMPPAGAVRADASTILAAAVAAGPNARPATLVIRSDPRDSAEVSFGRADVVYVDPYASRVLGTGATTARRLFQAVTVCHRWFSVSIQHRPAARAVTGAANLGFLVLAVSGVFLWWPRRRTATRLKVAIVLNPAARGRARAFNRHTVIGFWCAPALIVLSMTGAVMSYSWANNLLFAVAGGTPPRAGDNRPVDDGRASLSDFRQLDMPLRRAERMIATWASITLRVPARTEAPVSFTITDGANWNQFARSQLAVTAGSDDVRRWEPYLDSSRGQKVRGFFRFAHTGEAGGIAGQLLACAASVGGAWLVWTGLTLAFARVSGRLHARERERARAA